MTGPSWAGPVEGGDEVLVPCDACGGPMYESCRTARRARGQRDCGLSCEPRAEFAVGLVHWVPQGIVGGAEVVTAEEYVAITGPLDPEFDWPVPVATRDGVLLYLRPRDREVTADGTPGVPMEGEADRAEGDGSDATTEAAGSPTVQVTDTTFEELRGYPTTLPCPAWCQRGSGHGFEDVAMKINEGLLFRAHEVDLGPRVWVASEEYAVGADGPLWEVFEPLVYLEKQDGLDAAAARALAASLNQAADLLDLAERGA